jgi:hypothetical protein
MSDEFENDEILKRLRAEDPASSGAEAPGEREAVRASAVKRVQRGHAGPPWSIRPALVAVGALAVIALGVGLFLIIGGSGSGPTPALAIERTKDSITLTIEDSTASDDEMNAELEAAGIDRVRVMSVPGPPDAVGTWAGYVEIGATCEGGVKRYGYGVDIPSRLEKGEQHPSDRLIHVTIPESNGPLQVSPAGTPFSGATLRLDARTVDSPDDAAKILVPVRAESPDGEPGANAMGVDQLIALGGVFAQYGEAAEDGQTSCAEFGLKPYPPPTFPPPGNWVVLHISDTQAGARRMTAKLKAQGIDGEARLIPAQARDVGHYLGFEAVPPFPESYQGRGNRFDIDIGDYGPGQPRPTGTEVAFRRSAFTAYPDVHWLFYFGRTPRGGEQAQVMTADGPRNAKAELKAGCPSTVKVIRTNGRKSCGGAFPVQVPVQPGKRPTPAKPAHRGG